MHSLQLSLSFPFLNPHLLYLLIYLSLSNFLHFLSFSFPPYLPPFLTFHYLLHCFTFFCYSHAYDLHFLSISNYFFIFLLNSLHSNFPLLSFWSCIFCSFTIGQKSFAKPMKLINHQYSEVNIIFLLVHFLHPSYREGRVMIKKKHSQCNRQKHRRCIPNTILYPTCTNSITVNRGNRLKCGMFYIRIPYSIVHVRLYPLMLSIACEAVLRKVTAGEQLDLNKVVQI